MHGREVPSSTASPPLMEKRTRSLTSEVALSALVSPKCSKLSLKITIPSLQTTALISADAATNKSIKTVVNPLETDRQALPLGPSPSHSGLDSSSPQHCPVADAHVEKENMNRSLTNLSWLCDLRLVPCFTSRPGATQFLPPPPPLIDMSSNDDSFKRPNLSYAELICLAIESSTKSGVSLAEIYNFICDTFPYYRTTEPSWKNSVRYNLSQNKLFCKAPVCNQSKGGLWAIASRSLDGLSYCRGKRPSSKKKPAIIIKLEQAETIWEGEDEEEILLGAAEFQEDDPLAWRTELDLVKELKECTKKGGDCLAPGSTVGSEESADLSDSDDWYNAIPPLIRHPWAENSENISGAALTKGRLVAPGTELSISLSSCLSIWPLSASALVNEINISPGSLGLSGCNSMLNGAGVDLSQGLFDSFNGTSEGAIPSDWLP